MNESIEQQQKMMEKHGWVGHYVNGTGCYHTHGLKANFNHSDLEMDTQDPSYAHKIFHNIINQIKNGSIMPEEAGSHNLFYKRMINGNYKASLS